MQNELNKIEALIQKSDELSAEKKVKIAAIINRFKSELEQELGHQKAMMTHFNRLFYQKIEKGDDHNNANQISSFEIYKAKNLDLVDSVEMILSMMVKIGI